MMIKTNVGGWIFLILLSVVLLAPASMVGAGKVPHRVPEVMSKIRVDGRLDEDTWKKALVLELTYEFLPGENIKPPVRTEALLAYSRTHLYAAFCAYDPDPASIRARVTDRDKYGGDDWVGIVLDTFNDERRTYNFYCNPLGIHGDEIESPEGGGVEWDAIWNSAGRITSEGYIVEMAIPFSSLRFPRQKGDQVWGIDLIRSYPRSVRHLISIFPRDRSNNCYMCQAEKITGFAGVSPGKNIELDPTLASVLTQERENVTQGKFVKKESKLDPGITGRWGFTPNLTLALTVNPDFSNVEADAPQLDINTQFALFYTEKRPFFLEGATLFSTPFRVVYTRTLADPDLGIKLTGKEGRHAIGFFTVRDSITNLLFPGSQGSRRTSLPIDTMGSVLRYRFDLGKSSTAGLLVTDREGNDYSNRLGGVDADIRITPKDRLIFQFLGSQTHYSPDVSMDYNQPHGNFWGTALDVSYLHDARSLDWHISYRDVTADFRADLGFMPQADYRNMDVGGNYTWYRPKGYWFTRINLGAGYQLETDHRDNLLYKSLIVSLDYEGPAQSFVNLKGTMGRRTYRGIEFNDSKFFFTAGFQPNRNLQAVINGLFGRQIDIANIQEGQRFQLEGFIYYRYGRHLSMILDHVYERLDVDASRLYTANVSYMRLIYQFSRRAFLRTILQYFHYQYNTALYGFPVEPKETHLFSQVLFSYKINPQTVLFLGYSDDYYGYKYVPLTQANRTFFLKIGYALVF
ncbi:MAG: hypothetical protein GTO45_11265 [Candidatus Aminicenantes bacterium]|nr:hypothetical protein [Candidatus Aminicenantes bacterium]NIM79397.1 hypothetical protein [Candidatus Aminicenantes bacterium]NIN18674.1 hypothetical protein [Candidatus Aminicenantes bacterium]NIN42563.1 hypothetical protein [Candidatus Aminicenantes bacterium]NIN85329.1 hypothetical protein [Candidatus Aminicenantes bacterium]